MCVCQRFIYTFFLTEAITSAYNIIFPCENKQTTVCLCILTRVCVCVCVCVSVCDETVKKHGLVPEASDAREMKNTTGDREKE